VEAGLRSNDRAMPEEINRIVTDRLSDVLLAPSPDAVDNLRNEGVPPDRIHFVGNVMIDTLVQALPQAEARNAPARLGVATGRYVVTTLHRPANVDDPAHLRAIIAALVELSRDVPVLFPVHPRTRHWLAAMEIDAGDPARFRLLDPLGYLDMLSLVSHAALVITDSGGLQEETTFLGVPCLTVRPSTERPITCTQGTNRLVSGDRDALLHAARDTLRGQYPSRPAIDQWDGRAAERIACVLCHCSDGR
jgi:UDP-N-acetylglucosamine 2-epimerase (non-hydrolysing)